MEYNKVNIALVGLGHLGKIHLKCIKQSPHLHLVGVWDIDKSLQSKISFEENLQDCNTIKELFDQIDAVIIVSPTSTHAYWALHCIQEGKHFFIEKPVTATTEEASIIKKALGNKNLKIQVGHVERFNPAFLAIKNDIGIPMFIEGHRLAEFKPRGTDVSVIMDLMIHDIDLVLTMIPYPIKEIRASGVALMSPTADICNARIEFENGATANLTASRVSMKQMRKLRVFQPGHYFSMDLLKKETQVVKISDEAPLDHPLSWPVTTLNGTKHIKVEMPIPIENNAILEELNSFALSILNDESPVVSLSQGIRALEVGQKIQDIIELKAVR